MKPHYSTTDIVNITFLNYSRCSSAQGILMKRFLFLLLFTTQFIFASFASDATHFKILPLGTSGGELQDNLSAYLIAPMDSNEWVALDAGTLCSAIKKIPVAELQSLNVKKSKDENLNQTFFLHDIKAYLISHAHLDHISGMVICSTMDSTKEILGSATTINYLRDYIFNWKIWPNFTDEGKKPLLKQYHYHRLTWKAKNLISNTSFNVTPFLLNHGNGYPSTAFLLEAQNHYILYFGDTGADPVEHSQLIQAIWKAIAPLIKTHQLTTIFIECSYPNSRPDKMLFGHLNPRWLLWELRALAVTVNPEHPTLALKNLKIIVTHIKQGLQTQTVAPEILHELNRENKLGLKFIIPEQNKLIHAT